MLIRMVSNCISHEYCQRFDGICRIKLGRQGCVICGMMELNKEGEWIEKEWGI